MLMRAATRLGIVVSLGLLISFDTCFSYKFNENIGFKSLHTIDKEDLF